MTQLKNFKNNFKNLVFQRFFKHGFIFKSIIRTLRIYSRAPFEPRSSKLHVFCLLSIVYCLLSIDELCRKDQMHEKSPLIN